MVVWAKRTWCWLEAALVAAIAIVIFAHIGVWVVVLGPPYYGARLFWRIKDGARNKSRRRKAAKLLRFLVQEDPWERTNGRGDQRQVPGLEVGIHGGMGLRSR